MLWAFVDEAYNYDALYEKFYFYYAELPDDSLSDADWDTFGAIHEKMDFVAEDADGASRRDGWISGGEYRGRLRTFLKSHFPQVKP